MKLFGFCCATVCLVLTSSAIAVAEPPIDPLSGAPGLGDPYFPMDGNGGYDVSHYEVSIDYDPPTRDLIGKAVIDATATQALKSFNLDFAGPQIAKVAVNGTGAGFDRNGAHELTITPAQALLPGVPFTVAVEYAGQISQSESDKGWTILPSGAAVVAGQPHSARAWYPLNDTLLDKATFTLQVTVPADWEAVSIGTRIHEAVSDNKRTVRWEARHPVLGYLTMVAIDHFQYLEQRRADGTPLLSAFAPGALDKRDFEQRLPEVLDFEEKLYGPYPFETAGGVFLDVDIDASLETQTRPVYASWAKLSTIVHEISHQWWGDSITIRHWSDICLNECFAEYTAAYLWPERKDGVDVDQKYRETIRAHHDDPAYWRIPLEDPGAANIFDSVYDRGPLFVHALRKQIGDDVFFAAVREFATSYPHSATSMGDFRSFIQAKSRADLDGFFHAWLNTTAPPADEYLYPGALHG
ncbi:M1 family metallopeptidase [Nocardia sp. NPDC057030]|uniref:M1 family metallopeptidase n=1 Tax=unclassified Nocardia TaxID=2637762 RepID=UPI00363A1F92